MSWRDRMKERKAQREAAFREWDEAPKKSYYEQIKGSVEARGGRAKKAAFASACVLGAALIAATVAFGAASTRSAGLQPEPTSPAEAPSSPATYGAGEDGGRRPERAGGVSNIGFWDFLDPESAETVAGNLRDALAAAGAGESFDVHVYEGYEAVDGGYSGLLRTSPAEAYWKALVGMPGLEVSVERVEEAEALKATGTSPESAAAEERAAEDEAPAPGGEAPGDETPGGLSRPTPGAAVGEGASPAGTSYYNVRDLSEAVALSDSEGIAKILPPAAAATVEGAILDGVRREFSLDADPSLSRVFPNTVRQSGQSCSFTVICMASMDEKPLLLDVEYDPSTGAFAGAEAEQ